MIKASLIRLEIENMESKRDYHLEWMERYKFIEGNIYFIQRESACYYAARRAWLFKELIKVQLKEFDRG